MNQHKTRRRAPKSFQIKFEVSYMTVDGERTPVALYCRLGTGAVHRTVEFRDGINIDLNRNGRVLGVEILRDATIKLELMVEAAKEFDDPRLASINPNMLAAA